MKKIVSVLFSILLTGYLFGGEIDPGLKSKLDTMETHEFVEILVEMNVQADLTHESFRIPDKQIATSFKAGTKS